MSAISTARTLLTRRETWGELVAGAGSLLDLVPSLPRRREMGDLPISDRQALARDVNQAAADFGVGEHHAQ